MYKILTSLRGFLPRNAVLVAPATCGELPIYTVISYAPLKQQQQALDKFSYSVVVTF